MNYITTCSNIKTILMYTHHHIITFWSTSTLTRTLVQLYDVVRYRSMSDVCVFLLSVGSFQHGNYTFSSPTSTSLSLCLCFFLFFSLLILLSLERLLSFIFNLYLCLPTLFFSLSLSLSLVRLHHHHLVCSVYTRLHVFAILYMFTSVISPLISPSSLVWLLRFPSLFMSTHSSTRSLVEQLCEWCE